MCELLCIKNNAVTTRGTRLISLFECFLIFRCDWHVHQVLTPRFCWNGLWRFVGRDAELSLFVDIST